MAIVYRYLDHDGIPRYVGISKNMSTFQSRIAAHKYDKWHTMDKWTVQFFETQTMCDAQMLESHLIAEYANEGFHLFNKAKTNWGECSFLDEQYVPVWKTYFSEGLLDFLENILTAIRLLEERRKTVSTHDQMNIMIKNWLNAKDMEYVCIPMIKDNVFPNSRCPSHEIGRIMNSMPGWRLYSGKDHQAKNNVRRFPSYGRQRAWERVHKT